MTEARTLESIILSWLRPLSKSCQCSVLLFLIFFNCCCIGFSANACFVLLMATMV